MTDVVGLEEYHDPFRDDPRSTVLQGHCVSAAARVAATAAVSVHVARAVPSERSAAAAGDVVRVSPGVYSERVRITGARNGLTIEAADPSNPPVIQGKATAGHRHRDGCG